MPAFVPDLPAAAVDTALLESLCELRVAEKNSVLYFAEVMNRRLYRELGYASIQQYATERLQFSRSKTGHWIQLASAMKQLPRVRASVARGELPWTKAAEVVKVATRRTEKRWLDVAKSSGRRDLAAKVKQARGAALRRAGKPDLFATPGGQVEAEGGRARGPGSGSVTGPERTAGPGAGRDGTPGIDPENGPGATGPSPRPPQAGPSPAQKVPRDTGKLPPVARELPPTEELPPAATEVRLRMSSDQRARYEAMLEKLRKLGEKGAPTELVLEAMTRLVLERTLTRRREHIESHPPVPPGGSGHARIPSGLPESDRARAQPRPGTQTRAGTRVGRDGSEEGSTTNRPRGSSRLDPGNTSPANDLADSSPRVRRTGASVPVYQVYVRVCESCDRGWIETSTGPRLLEMHVLRTILCDARVSRPGEPNRHAIPPGLRRRALERDRYRCRVRGCGSHRFLSVHHLHAREDGGAHELENLITLCGPCHTMVHRLKGPEPALNTNAA